MAGFRERAFLVCRGGAGELSAGPVVTGSHDHVPMPQECPLGTRAIGVCHDHPPGDSIEPSDADVRETKDAGLEFVCVVFDGELKCYPV